MNLEQKLDAALAEYDDALCAGRFAEVDAKLAAYTFSAEGDALDVAVTVLMATKPARTHLPARAAAVERFVALLPADRRSGIEPYL